MQSLLFDSLFHTQPEQSVFIKQPDGREFSYGNLRAESARVANVLTKLGARPGDRVAVQIDKSIAAVALYLGTIRAGCVFLPLNTAYTASEIDYFLQDASPAVFVCQTEQQSSIETVVDCNNIALKTLSADGHRGSWAELVNTASADFRTIARSADDLAAILYTSGTTGRSKGAMLTHQNLTSNAQTLTAYWQFTASDVLLHALPIFHTHGLFVAINTTMVAGASLLFLPTFNAKSVLQHLPACSVMMGVPTFYTRLLSLDTFNREAVAHMRLFISGSAPMTLETHKAFKQRTGQTVLERYGMTETNMNTSNPYLGERIAGSVGLALPGVEVRITDPNAEAPQSLDQTEIGMIEVRGPNVFPGYWQMPEKTAEELRPDGFFITGDLGMIDDKGYIHIVGRNRDMIISGGYNVYPKEIEILIDALDDVAESAVVGLPHADLGESVVVFVVMLGRASMSEAGILDGLKGKLARYKQPRKVIFVEQLPRNAMGKVQKNELRQRYSTLFQSQ